MFLASPAGPMTKKIGSRLGDSKKTFFENSKKPFFSSQRQFPNPFGFWFLGFLVFGSCLFLHASGGFCCPLHVQSLQNRRSAGASKRKWFEKSTFLLRANVPWPCRELFFQGFWLWPCPLCVGNFRQGILTRSCETLNSKP